MLEIKSIKNNQNFIEKDVDDLSKSKVVKRLKLSNHWVQNVNN